QLSQWLYQVIAYLKYSGAALDRLTEAGFDPVYGARPLKRTIQQLLENPLAQELLAGNYVSGNTIYVNVEDDQIVFH
ncbi:MAG: hypothetical protein HQL46_12245, partial [Gammaproteobacteria bacterium]|nr:hypothetical protein [Gammaproteobacteria bacterium]